MQISPIKFNTLNERNAQMVSNPERRVSFGTAGPFQLNADTFCASASDILSAKDFQKISDLISEADKSNVNPSLQGMIHYKHFMVKAPDSVISDTAVKEFYALGRIQNSVPNHNLTPKPAALSKCSDRHYFVETFIEGKHASDVPLSFKNVTKMMDKLAYLDQSGIINQDLSPANIILTKKGPCVIDFDAFSAITSEGRVVHSQNTAPTYFAARLPKKQLLNTDYISYAGKKAEKDFVASAKELFEASFTVDRKPVTDMHNLIHVRNLSENPYLNVPSNLANFECRSIFQRFIDGDVDDPAEFLKSYIRLKAKKYHPKMKKFLETLEIDRRACENGDTILSYSEVKQKLKNAIEYEDFLSNLFANKKPDDYFAKFEAAKIQLLGLMHFEDLKEGISNKEQLHSAYDKVIAVIMEGRELYRGDERYQKYLSAELMRFRDAFEHTDFSISKAPKPIYEPFDLLKTFFSDPAVDKGSYAYIHDGINAKLVKKAMNEFVPEKDEFSLEAIKACKRDVFATAKTLLHNEAGDRISPANVEKGAKKIMDEVMQEVYSRAKQKGIHIATMPPEEQVVATVQEVSERITDVELFKPVLRGFADAQTNIANYTQKYQNIRQIRSGGKIFAILGGIMALGGFIGFQYTKLKNLKKEKQNPTLNK